MFNKFLRPFIKRVNGTVEVARPAANESIINALLDERITHPEGDEIFGRLTRERIYPADFQNAA